MANHENRFAKTSSEAIKSLVFRAVPGNTTKKKQNKIKYAVNVFEGLAEFTGLDTKGNQLARLVEIHESI